jgi:polyhydroxyalkanoate synthesis regulator phasin
MTARGAAALDHLVRGARVAGRQLWLAGLGAAATAAGSAPRLAAHGRQLVERLVEKGQPLARRQTARAESLAGQAGRTTRGARTLLRETAEYETRRLLERFGLATVEDLRVLAAHLETLDKKLDDYGRRIAHTAG